MKKLRANDLTIVTKPDKGNGVVIMDKQSYINGIYKIINDTTKFKKLTKDPTIKREGQLQRYLRKLKKEGHFTEDIYSKIYPSGSQPAKIYGQPKLHKSFAPESIPPLRPIVSSISTFNYNLSKYFCNLISPHIPVEYCPQDSFTFTKELKEVSFVNKFVVSYDVVSLFTNIPLIETINLAVDLIKANNKNIKMTNEQLKQLLIFCTSETHFLFNGEYYQQVDGVAMGSPLAPILANLFMGIKEKEWIKNYNGNKPLLYKRYVDDIFAIFQKQEDAERFLKYINLQHQNIKFTMETQKNNTISFLGIFLDFNSGNLITKTFRKKTFTGVLTNFLSYTPFQYKLRLISTLLDRAFKINNTWKGLHHDFQQLSVILQKNCFPSNIINNKIKMFLQSKMRNQDDKSNIHENTKYFSLPYLGTFSKTLKIQIRKLNQRLCNNIDLKIIFRPLKIKNFFSNKDRISSDKKAHVIYKFVCACCNACYIGETSRHLSVRITEHLQSDKQSHIYKHIHENLECFNACDKNCFVVLDTGMTKKELKIKEGLYISWQKPNLNVQLPHFSSSLLF